MIRHIYWLFKKRVVWDISVFSGFRQVVGHNKLAGIRSPPPHTHTHTHTNSHTHTHTLTPTHTHTHIHMHTLTHTQIV
jgi:hypothetical protein